MHSSVCGVLAAAAAPGMETETRWAETETRWTETRQAAVTGGPSPVRDALGRLWAGLVGAMRSLVLPPAIAAFAGMTRGGGGGVLARLKVL